MTPSRFAARARSAARRRGTPRAPRRSASNGTPSSRPTATRRQRVQQVVAARHAQAQRRRARVAGSRPATPHRGSASRTLRAARPCARDVGAAAVEAVGDDAARASAAASPRTRRVVGARDHRAVERHLVGEVDERLLQVVEAAVALHVLVIDVRDHRDRRRQLQERPIALVRLGDHVARRCPSRALLPNALSRPPITAVGSSPRALEHERDHRRRGRLAVRAGDGDAVAAAASARRASRRAGSPGSAARARLDDLRVVRPHRRRHDDDVGVADVARRRARSTTRTPSVASRSVIVRSLRVRSADRVAEVARAARRCRSCRCRRCRRSESAACVRASAPAASSSARSTITARGVGPRQRRAPRRHRAAARPSRDAARRCAPASRRAGQVRLRRAAPPRRPRAAPRRSSAGDRRSRSAAAPESPRRPAAVSSAMRRRAGAADDHDPPRFISRSMAKRNGSTRAASPRAPVGRRGPVPDRALLSDA